MLYLTDAWNATFPATCAGALALTNVVNPPSSPALDPVKATVEAGLRARFGGGDPAAIRALPVVAAYSDYFKRFKKTYHVLLQMESVAFKGKAIPSVAALVEAMFAVEVKNGLLTAGHDLEACRGAIRLDVATGGEAYTTLGGQGQSLKAGDQYMADEEGVISSVLYGPDQRTAIGASTRRVLFTVYGVPGIAAGIIFRHLEDIRDNALLVCPEARVEHLEVYGAT